MSETDILQGKGRVPVSIAHPLVFTHWRTMLQTLAQTLQVAPAEPASGTKHIFDT